jgi:hypothetical protein
VWRVWSFRDQHIDNTANDGYGSSNSQAVVQSKESDDIIIESYVDPSSKGQKNL